MTYWHVIFVYVGLGYYSYYVQYDGLLEVNSWIFNSFAGWTSTTQRGRDGWLLFTGILEAVETVNF